MNLAGNMTTVPHSQLEMLEATHRGLHKFNPRHHDEIEVEIGDPIYVQKEADDLWCEGMSFYRKSSLINHFFTKLIMSVLKKFITF